MQMTLLESKSFVLFVIAEALLCVFLCFCYFFQSRSRFEQEGLIKFSFLHMFACGLLLFGFFSHYHSGSLLKQIAPFCLFFGTYAKLGAFPFHKFAPDFYQSSSFKMIVFYHLFVLSFYTFFALSLPFSFFHNFNSFHKLTESCAYIGLILCGLYMIVQIHPKRIFSYFYSGAIGVFLHYF